jgi:uncharacterized protein YyaL (SSP411 family)
MSETQDTLHPHQEQLVDEQGRWRYANALTQQTSPYLLQHAHNPVDWQPWAAQAFEQAKQDQKPIFLSVGYSTCYWCHVMERQVFEDPRIAELLNQACVSIKVDREERPDVDELYMTAVQMMTGHGGWPMSVFLTPPSAGGEDDPGLKPFWAGTYIPPKPMHGMPSFPQLIQSVQEAWQQRRQDILEQAEKVTDAMTRYFQRSPTQTGLPATASIQAIANALMESYDARHAGFGSAPKFPQPATLSFLRVVAAEADDQRMEAAVSDTLLAMARGGIYDQVGGGFHRYSTDEKWLVPHFEKMLYDNGQLLSLYAQTLSKTEDSATRRVFDRVLRETADYVLREMVDETGAFYSAQDAEVNGREGSNYLWTDEQVREALHDEVLSDLAIQLYGLDQGTNFRDPHDPEAQEANVLYLPKSLAVFADSIGKGIQVTEAMRNKINERLLKARNQREQPRTDDKVLVSWNGMMIAGLADAGQVLEQDRYIDAARRAADAIASHLWQADGRLYRTMRQGTPALAGQLEDYAFYAHGLLRLHQVTGEATFCDHARQLMTQANALFEAAAGGFYDSPPDQDDLLLRLSTAIDGSIPSGNSQMVHNLLDLYELTGEQADLDRALKTLGHFGESLTEQGRAMTQMAKAAWRAAKLAPERFAGQTPEPVQTGKQDSTAKQPVRLYLERTLLDLNSGADQVRLHVQVAEGYHINTADPGDSTLTPTQVWLEGAEGLSLTVDYPQGHTRRFALSEQALDVYEGHLILVLHLKKISDETGQTKPVLAVQYQPCDDSACLEPQTERFELRMK